jgi:hypothetical protein
MIKNKSNFFQMIIIGLVTFFIISIPLNNLILSLKLTLTYLIFIYLPFLPIVSKIKKLNTLEKFIINNMIGLSYGFIYVILDVFLKIPLSKITFIAVTGIILAFNLFFYHKISKRIKKIPFFI